MENVTVFIPTTGLILPGRSDINFHFEPPSRTISHKSQRTRFTNPASLAAEVDFRLSRCGLDRYLIIDRYVKGLSIEEIARYVCMENDQICRRINAVLRYISGWRRKEVTYKEYKRSHRWKKLLC